MLEVPATPGEYVLSARAYWPSKKWSPTIRSIPGFKAVEKLLSNVEVDALGLLLPHDLHREYVEVAARYRKHVYLEKPIANSCEEA
jgi:predicted dehydrogenase